ncbi:hypothetical protein Ahy_A04g019795 [Arachis hypogaea]|uniref:Uncharacterized protein n=1 Tax=Arachis hypogaea TaxID=3818 RepID=A0A445DGK5_ARAHY|nr:hypothetical protein Ahy_A04g019795 [Arachis hypogaea]
MVVEASVGGGGEKCTVRLSSTGNKQLGERWVKMLRNIMVIVGFRGKACVVCFEKLFGELSPDDCIDEFTVSFSWFQNKFRVMPTNVSEVTVQVYTRGYIMMLLSMMLFGDKSGARVHLR